jgi:hypothetical protein
MSTNDQILPLIGFGNAIRRIDKLRQASIAAHLVILVYVGAGWTITSRPFLYVYLLILPGIILQWLLNCGSSIVNNFENLARTGCWDDDGNVYQGAFLQLLLSEVGLVLPNFVINMIACILMFVLWVAAMWRMILIVPVPSG